jgi:hypothetical protein
MKTPRTSGAFSVQSRVARHAIASTIAFSVALGRIAWLVSATSGR